MLFVCKAHQTSAMQSEWPSFRRVGFSALDADDVAGSQIRRCGLAAAEFGCCPVNERHAPRSSAALATAFAAIAACALAFAKNDLHQQRTGITAQETCEVVRLSEGAVRAAAACAASTSNHRQ